MDILQATLAAGIKVQKYVPSYGDQPNDVTHVVKCKCPLLSDVSLRTDFLCAIVKTSATSSRDITYVQLRSVLPPCI